MNNEEIRDLTLRRLLDDNFSSSKRFRKLAEGIEDASLKYYFQSLASRRSQFAIELAEEIFFYNGKKFYTSSTFNVRKWDEMCLENKARCIKKAFRLKKTSLQKYQEALCRIHDGSCREVLLRHKAYLENCIFELKALKSLLRYSSPKEEQLDEMQSQS